MIDYEVESNISLYA